MIISNYSIIQWFLKNHSIVETSIFRYKFTYVKIIIGTLYILIFKLIIMVVEVSGPYLIYINNVCIINNT